MGKLKENSKGFTLIELLVVVLVIGALSGLMLGVINSGGIRQKARDSQRKADLTKIATALELYFAEFRQYPRSDGDDTWQLINGACGNPLNDMECGLIPNYLESVPADPLATSTSPDPCAADGSRYNYRTAAGGSAFVLTAIMEVPTSNDDSLCSTLSNITSSSIDFDCTLNTTDFCYGVQNP